MKKIICYLALGALAFACFAACTQNDASSTPLAESTNEPALSSTSENKESFISTSIPNAFSSIASSESSNTFSMRDSSVLSDTSQPEIPDNYSKVPSIDNIASFYTRNPSGYTYVGCWLDFWNPDYSMNTDSPLGKHEQKILDGIAVFGGLEPANEEHQITDNEFLLWTTDGVRHIYGTGRGGYFIADGKTFILPTDKLQTIEELHQYMISQNANHNFTEAYPQWLKWMTPSKIQEIVFHSPTRGPLPIAPALMKYAAEVATQSVKSTGDSTYKLGSVDFSGDDVFHLEIRFNGGVVYHIYAINSGYEADYYVESSDMSYGCKYHLLMSSVDGAAQLLIDDFEFIADAKSMKDVENSTT